MQLIELYTMARERLRGSSVENPGLEASIMLRELGVIDGFSRVYANPCLQIENEIKVKMSDLIERRIKNEPISYITEKKEFYSREFKVNSSVLIPRPETEELVSETIKTARGFGNPFILDVGTGSGCIAVTLACELVQPSVWASDVSADALSVAAINAGLHECGGKLNFILTDMTSGFKDGAFDIVVSNPPYISPREYENLDHGIRDFEPGLALLSEHDGLYHIKGLAQDAGRLLRTGGYCLTEIGAGQSAIAVELFNSAGFEEITAIRDLNNIERVIRARWKK